MLEDFSTPEFMEGERFISFLSQGGAAGKLSGARFTWWNVNSPPRRLRRPRRRYVRLGGKKKRFSALRIIAKSRVRCLSLLFLLKKLAFRYKKLMLKAARIVVEGNMSGLISFNQWSLPAVHTVSRM